MVKFYVRMAELVISVSAMYEETKQLCKDYLLEDIPCNADIEVCVTTEDILREKELLEKSNSEWYSDKYLENIVVLRQIARQLSKFHRVFFHGSAIAVDGEVYLFTAPSGTGKSTHTRLWKQHLGEHAVMVNDDKPIIQMKTDGNIIVYGTPWDGKHRLSNNIGLPLKGICILSQAKENKIRRISKEDGFGRIYLQTYHVKRDTNNVATTLKVIEGMLKFPLWHLECNVSEEAAKLSYEMMSGKKWNEKVYEIQGGIL